MDRGNRRKVCKPEPFGSCPKGASAGDARHMQDAVGRLLQSHYRELIESPLPEELRGLIARLGEREQQQT